MLPLCEDCSVGEVVSGGFQGPFVRGPHGSASDEVAKAADPLGPFLSSSLPPARERDASLFVFPKPLPIVLLPHIPLEGCHVPPFPNAWPRLEAGIFLSSLLLLPAELNSPNRVGRVAPVGRFVVAEDIFTPTVDMLERMKKIGDPERFEICLEDTTFGVC